MDPLNFPHVDLPLLSPFLLLSYFIKNNGIPLAHKRARRGIVAISFSSSDNQVRDRIRVKEVESKLRLDIINLDRDNKDRIPLREFMVRVSTLASLSFCELRLELRDKDLEDEEFQLDEAH